MSTNFRELEKAILQHLVLPLAYMFFCCGKEVEPRKAVFADSKNDGVPYSLRSMYQEAQKRGYECIDFCYNFETMSVWRKLYTSLSFMKQYATAKYIFICDYYLPVSSCHKRNETVVAQLWHASGLQKKFGYDTEDDLKNLKLVNPTRNFDLVCVSAENVKQVIMKNWRLPAEKVQVLGSSRTDILFDKEYLAACREKFYRLYPEAKGKKVVLWAPTFRGKGYDASIVGIEGFNYIQEKLDNKWFLIAKLHPRVQGAIGTKTCKLKTEELYAVTDCLITDYSSVFFDYILIKSDVIFFVPDYEQYTIERGLYIDYTKEFKFPVVATKEELLNVLMKYKSVNTNEIIQYRNKFVIMNDGNASERILNFLEGEKVNASNF